MVPVSSSNCFTSWARACCRSTSSRMLVSIRYFTLALLQQIVLEFNGSILLLQELQRAFPFELKWTPLRGNSLLIELLRVRTQLLLRLRRQGANQFIQRPRRCGYSRSIPSEGTDRNAHATSLHMGETPAPLPSSGILPLCILARIVNASKEATYGEYR